MSAPPLRRCAIYTRKSSEEGLEQAFNSLDAQREASEAYIKSQAHEGWRLLPSRFDDGGFSGGSMDRPGLQRLLEQIDAGKIDIVVVYKVDRLTRSLADFARIVDRFDARGASFVSVTQAFNTTTSMGRLTLNVLLSFAQYEREITGERIRDKIAASKKKGMWMGGTTPYGYAAKDRALVIEPAEAEIVRSLFQRYLELGSVARLHRSLIAEGVRHRSGSSFQHGALYHVLANRTYLGKIVHKDEAYPGQHPAIIEQAVFDAVQAKLAAQTKVRRKRQQMSAPLMGLVFDEAGTPMTPSFSLSKHDRPYRYYVSTSTQRGEVASRDQIRRIGAPALEGFCFDRLKQFDPAVVSSEALTERIQRVDIRDASVRLQIKFTADQARDRADREAILGRASPGEEVTWERGVLHLTCPVRMKFRGGRTWIKLGDRPVGAARRVDPVLVGGLRRAAKLVQELAACPQLRPNELLRAEGPGDPYRRKLCQVAFLAPDIQRAIFAGAQPPQLSLQDLLDAKMPASWVDQRAMFGFPKV